MSRTADTAARRRYAFYPGCTLHSTGVEFGASSELVSRLVGLPAEVQVWFLGLLAARCQRLIEVLEVVVGPRLSLDRMRRYALSNDLPTVAGLDASPRPEYGSWAEDARQWWAVLDMG